MRRCILIVAAVLGAAWSAPAQTIVDLDSAHDCTGVGGGRSVALSAGTYIATAIGPAEGGSFLSWNAWGGSVSGCQPDGFGCVQGWWTLFFVYQTANVRAVSLGGAMLASTEAQGLENRHRWMFRLCDDGDVRFGVPDGTGSCADNIGGVSIRIDRACAADLDADGVLSVFDFLEFQNRFDGGDLLVDLDCDGELTLFDFLAFQNAFDAGCP